VAIITSGLGWGTEAGHQRFDFRRDLGFMSEYHRAVVQQEFTAEPVSTRTELDGVHAGPAWVERGLHWMSVTLGLPAEKFSGWHPERIGDASDIAQGWVSEAEFDPPKVSAVDPRDLR